MSVTVSALVLHTSGLGSNPGSPTKPLPVGGVPPSYGGGYGSIPYSGSNTAVISMASMRACQVRRKGSNPFRSTNLAERYGVCEMVERIKTDVH